MPLIPVAGDVTLRLARQHSAILIFILVAVITIIILFIIAILRGYGRCWIE